jgi:hypothetical protein
VRSLRPDKALQGLAFQVAMRKCAVAL